VQQLRNPSTLTLTYTEYELQYLADSAVGIVNDTPLHLPLSFMEDSRLKQTRRSSGPNINMRFHSIFLASTKTVGKHLCVERAAEEYMKTAGKNRFLFGKNYFMERRYPTESNDFSIK
jgi:hypothetical protein